jgi:EmrB/QacA subfamily drug resistance transporter
MDPVAARRPKTLRQDENMTQSLSSATTPTTTGTSSPGPRPDAGGWATLLVTLCGTFVTFLDFFIVNVAMPSVRDDLRAGAASVSLVVAGYGLTFAVGLITGGRLGDRYGRRRMFGIGLALFTAASAACGFAPTIEVLVAGRFAQGAAAALLSPQVLAILGSTYTGARRQKAFAAYGFAMGIAGVLGQLLGGVLIEGNVFGSGWRAIFLINIPVGIVALTLLRRHVPRSYGDQARLDPVGAMLITAALTLLVLPLVSGADHGWPTWTWISLAAAPAMATVFVGQQRHRRAGGHSALVDLSLLGNRSFAAGSMVATLFGMVPPAVFFVLAMYLQDGRGLGPLASGTVFGAVGVGYFLAMLVAGRLTTRLGHQVLAVGAVLVLLGCAAMIDVAHASSILLLLPGLALTGFGIGAVLVPVTAMVLATVTPQQAGAGSGMLATGQQIGGAVGVALSGLVYFAAGDSPAGFTSALLLVAGLAVVTAAAAQLLRSR